MPHIRAQTARRLSSQGLRQARIAEHLGVSQAMVSKYLRAVPKAPAGLAPALLQGVVDRAVASAVEQEKSGRLPAWCPLCPELALRTASEGLVDECLRGETPPSRDEAAAVLRNLREAAERLRGGPFARLAPEVGVNIAMSTTEARDPRGVAAVPGRFAAVRGRLQPAGEPEFGASQHLSDVLLRARREAPAVRAILCIKADDRLRKAMDSAGLRSRVLRRQRGELVVDVAPSRLPDALIDPGAFGIEPITYLLGSTALDVVEKAERITRHLQTKAKP